MWHIKLFTSCALLSLVNSHSKEVHSFDDHMTLIVAKKPLDDNNHYLLTKISEPVCDDLR